MKKEVNLVKSVHVYPYVEFEKGERRRARWRKVLIAVAWVIPVLLLRSC